MMHLFINALAGMGHQTLRGHFSLSCSIAWLSPAMVGFRCPEVTSTTRPRQASIVHRAGSVGPPPSYCSCAADGSFFTKS
jgi:hypothetical protein